MFFKNKFKIILAVLLVILVIGWLVLVVLIYRQSAVDEAGSANAIVVLGAAQWGGAPSPIYKARLEQALSLYILYYAPHFILTGGIGEGENISEAAVGRSYLIAKGIPKEVIFIEEAGRTTWQSLNEAKKIIEEKNFKDIILVSDGFHMFRLKKMARDLGIQALVSPVKLNPIGNFTKFRYIFRESYCYILYLLFRI